MLIDQVQRHTHGVQQVVGGLNDGLDHGADIRSSRVVPHELEEALHAAARCQLIDWVAREVTRQREAPGEREATLLHPHYNLGRQRTHLPHLRASEALPFGRRQSRPRAEEATGPPL